MLKRPIFWGAILSMVGLLGWWLFVILTVVSVGKFRDLSNFFGILMLSGLPFGLLIPIQKKYYGK